MCVHELGGDLLQIKLCRLAVILFHSQNDISDENLELFNGVMDGFNIVDCEEMPSNDCVNYKSIYDPPYKQKIDDIVRSELSYDVISVLRLKLHCIFSWCGS